MRTGPTRYTIHDKWPVSATLGLRDDIDIHMERKEGVPHIRIETKRNGRSRTVELDTRDFTDIITFLIDRDYISIKESVELLDKSCIK